MISNRTDYTHELKDKVQGTFKFNSESVKPQRNLSAKVGN